MTAPTRYEICVRGVLGEALLSAFPMLSSEGQDGVTVLSGFLPDQAALHGVLVQIESLGLELLSVPASTDPPAASRRGVWSQPLQLPARTPVGRITPFV